MQTCPMPRDLRWDNLVTVCERLAKKYDPGRVTASERRRGFWLVAGIEAPQFAVFEPVMRRRPFSRSWEELSSIEEAAERAVAVLREGT